MYLPGTDTLLITVADPVGGLTGVLGVAAASKGDGLELDGVSGSGFLCYI